MTRSPLVSLLLTAALVLAALNIALAAWSHRLPYEIKLETIRAAQDPNLLIVGNSLLAGHIDEQALEQAEAEHGVAVRPLNSALGASEPPEQRLLFNYASGIHPGIRELVVGIYDFQLTAPDHTRLADLVGNRMVGTDKRFPLSEVASAYGFGRADRIKLELLRDVPMAANRANIWKYVELLRRRMDAMGMPYVATNSFGRVDDFAALEARSPEAFDAQAEAFLQHPEAFNSSYESIFGDARRANMSCVIVVMPASPWHRRVFYARASWSRYLAALERLAAERGILVIDASDWFLAEQDFVDRFHMTLPAAHDFSLRLGGELSNAAVAF